MASRKSYWQKEWWERERSSKRYQDFRRRQLARLGDECWICGHPGASDLDHVMPLAERPDLMYDEANARVAHGSTGCPQCPTKQNGARRCCNQERNRELAAVRRDGGSRAPVTITTQRSPSARDPRGCPTCHGELCNNGVPDPAGADGFKGFVVRCW